MTTTDRKKRRSPEMRTPFRLEFTGSPTQPTDRPVTDSRAAEIAERTRPRPGTWDYVEHGTRDIDALLTDRAWCGDQIAQLQQERDEARAQVAMLLEEWERQVCNIFADNSDDLDDMHDRLSELATPPTSPWLAAHDKQVRADAKLEMQTVIMRIAERAFGRLTIGYDIDVDAMMEAFAERERAEERERCANIVEQKASAWGMFNATDLRLLAAEIRAGKGE